MRILERLKKTEQRFEEIQTLLSSPDAAKDRNRFQLLTKELAQLRPIVEGFVQYQRSEKEIEGLKQSLEQAEDDAAMKLLIEEEIKALQGQQAKRSDELESLFLRGTEPNAARDVILEIRAGTGGEEAALFAADLFRMYTQYAAEQGLRVEVMDLNPTGIGGFKEIIFGVSGDGAYSKLKYESGIHRVQRVPRTEASGRIHTSAVTVAVLPEAAEEELEIQPKDLKIDVFRASGAGGQHVNKTESAVRITHIPTGFVVSCQDERSQHKNKLKAMRILRAKIFEMKQQQQDAEIAKARKEQVGSGDRSGKIRTYNFPDQRVTDHRIGLTLHSLNDILNGHLEPVIRALEEDEKVRRLTQNA